MISFTGSYKSVYALPCKEHVLKTCSDPHILREREVWEDADPELRSHLAPVVLWGELGSQEYMVQQRVKVGSYPGERYELEKLLGEYGISDVHLDNVGWLNGKMVCIDWGML